MINILNSIYGNCIKYERMQFLTNKAFKGYNDNELNIFIDLYPIFRTLYKADYIESNSNVDICAGIINTAAHYRRFFMRYYNTYATIYMINSLNIHNMNLNLYPEYNKDLKHRVDTATPRMNNLVPFNLDLLDLVIPYIDNVYLIHSTYESSVVMYDIICKNELNGNLHPNLIISRDTYPFQLTGIVNNTLLYRPKKRDGLDLSYCVNSNNLYNAILYENGIDYKKYDFKDISPKLFSMLFTLNGFKRRNIRSEYNIRSAKKLITNAIDNQLILNDYNHIINWDQIQTKKNPNMLNNIYLALDIISQHYIYMNDLESHYKLKNLYDPEGIKSINNKYFTNNNQLDLEGF